MEDINCHACGRFIGRESQGKLYDENAKVLAEDELVGYCIRCRNLVVWRAAGLVTMEEAEVPQAPINTPPMPEIGLPSLPIDKDLPNKIAEAKKNRPVQETFDTAPIRLPNRPPMPVVKPKPDGKPEKPASKPEPQQVFVVFGKSKIYHSVDHYEDKVGKVIFDTTGYELCKICDGFVKAGLVNE